MLKVRKVIIFTIVKLVIIIIIIRAIPVDFLSVANPAEIVPFRGLVTTSRTRSI